MAFDSIAGCMPFEDGLERTGRSVCLLLLGLRMLSAFNACLQGPYWCHRTEAKFKAVRWHLLGDLSASLSDAHITLLVSSTLLHGSLLNAKRVFVIQ